MVVTSRPLMAANGSWQERTGTPSNQTVQAPHWATPQPYLAPTKPRRSRNAHSRGISGSASFSSWALPLTLSCMVDVPFLVTLNRCIDYTLYRGLGVANGRRRTSEKQRGRKDHYPANNTKPQKYRSTARPPKPNESSELRYEQNNH